MSRATARLVKASTPAGLTRDRFFSAELSRRERHSARHHGRRDGARGIPPVPDGSLASGPAQHPTLPRQVWTPYIVATDMRTSAASTVLAARLLEVNRDLIVTVYRRAEVVVWAHDVQRHLTDGTRGRFVLSLNRWRVTATACRPWAEAATAHANQLVAQYWLALSRRHRGISGRERTGSTALVPAR